MDLHFNESVATEEERAAVDEVLDDPDIVSQSAQKGENSRSPLEGSASKRRNRHLLLPVLHGVQSRIGWISPGALNYLCFRMGIPPAEAYGVASFYALFSMTEQPPIVAHVCDDIVCKTRGAEALCSRLESIFGQPGTPGETGISLWKRSPCLGLCDQAPAALFQNAGADKNDYSLAPANVEGLLLGLQGEVAPEKNSNFAMPKPIENALALTGRIGKADPMDVDDYHSKGGFASLRRALKIGASEIIREVRDSGLCGRGGAAFPTGVKWKAVAEAPERPHYVVCNADESEPGAFKDRTLMEGDPFALIEAMTIAGFACGAEKGYIYIRGEYPVATFRLRNAIELSRRRGFLGDDILSSGVRFDIELRRGAGAYICGEETALLESIEGKRGEPRNKPPFPVSFGLFGKPTAINNVETLMNILPILAMGGEAYAKIGSERSTGTRVFCVSGCVERPGVYEVNYGCTLGDMLELAGGLRKGHALQAILLGGAAGTFVRPEELDILLTLEGTRAANATLGSGGIVFFDDQTEMKAILARIAAFFRDESCGQCVPCRVGTVRQQEALLRLFSPNGDTGKELALLSELDQVMRDASICGLGQTASSAIFSAIKRLRLFQGGSQ